MLKGVEYLCMKLLTMLFLEQQIPETIAGFMTPNFVVDLPGARGKGLACSYNSYDKEAGVVTFSAPGISGTKAYTYYDPLL